MSSESSYPHFVMFAVMIAYASFASDILCITKDLGGQITAFDLAFGCLKFSTKDFLVFRKEQRLLNG